MNTYCVGDLHANYKGFKQALERSDIKEGDTLISLCDWVDGHSEVYELMELLVECSKKYNLICIKSNHDEVFLQWLETGIHPWNWQQGGLATAKSYMKHLGIEDGVHIKSMGGYIVKLNPGDIPQSHIDLFKSQIPYYKDDKNNLFIHGGFNRHFLLSEQSPEYFWWDRDLWSQALSWESMSRGMLDKKPEFKIKEKVNDIFIGHTCTSFFEKGFKPMRAANIWNLDTSGGWGGKITIMNVDTKEYFQSDEATFLYPDFKGRS